MKTSFEKFMASSAVNQVTLSENKVELNRVNVNLGNVNVLSRLLAETSSEYIALNKEVDNIFKLLRIQVRKGDVLIDKMLEATKQYGELKKDFENIGLNFEDYREAIDYKTMASRVVGVKNLVAEIKNLVQ